MSGTFDFKAIADAIATRFSSANVTAPSGATNVRVSSASLPDAITAEPTVLVFPVETADFDFESSTRTGVARFPVRFYIYRVRDTSRNAVLLNNWATVLYGQLDGKVQLGLGSYVAYSVIKSFGVGPLTYGEGDSAVRFHGIEFSVEVHLAEGIAFTA